MPTPHPRKPFVFIVYQDTEYLLADKLKSLLECWGYAAFHCRQGERETAFWKGELRTNIRQCDLVLLLLSREFRWSNYCQAEAGITMALEKPFIPVIVPPADRDEVEHDRVAQMLEGAQYLYASDPAFINNLHEKIREVLAQSKAHLQRLIDSLQIVAAQEVAAPQVDPTVEDDRRKEVAAALTTIATDYRLNRPQKQLSSAWPSLASDACKKSVVDNIIRSLENDNPETTLVVVGVSLKFSLDLITEALGRIRQRARNKVLRIAIVHMDSQAHILHALRDNRDIDAIGLNFDGDEWERRYATWKALCAAASITLEPPVLHRIDYMPTRVGILIDDTILYSGRCTIEMIGDADIPLVLAPGGWVGNPIFHLYVGENKYLYYQRTRKTKGDDATFLAMREFKGSLVAYSRKDNNTGITPVWSSDEWINRLRKHIHDCAPAAEITFISATATKFEPLIRDALQRRAKVRIYVHELHPRTMKDLTSHLQKNIGASVAAAEVIGYKHSPTFRAIVVADNAIGLQPYVSTGKKSLSADTIKKLPLCFIATRCFNRFAELREHILDI